MAQKIKITRQSRYAPLRYEATRPYAVQLGRLFNSHASGKPAEKRMNFISTQLMPLVKAAVERLGKADGPGAGQAEIGNIQIFGGYLSSGRIIFDVRNELSRSLLVTDAQDVPCNALTFPCEAFYIHFGYGTGLSDKGLEIEGVFVQHLLATPDEPSRLMVDLVPVGYFSARNFWTLPMGEALTGISIELSNPNEPLVDALDRAISDVVKRNKEMLAQYAEFEHSLSEQYGQVVKVPTPIDDLEDKRDLLRRALQLTTNTLFYLAAEPDDIYEDWDSEAPVDLIQQTHSEKFGTRKTAENTLSSKGYMKVRYVGSQYAKSSSAKEISDAFSSGRTVQTHFRRGHFRRQPHGPENSLRKTVFIAPVVVNAGQGELQGRIYEVGAT